MQIILNGDAREVADKSSLSQLVDSLQLKGKRLAIEVNEEIIPRSAHDTYTLQDGDQVEIVHAIGGG
ncbi:MAG: sulfur carrier protein ThiS [Gammaproteobacteria bacterium]